MFICYQFQNWMNGVFPLGIFSVLLWGGLILFGLGYLVQRFFRFLRSRLTKQNKDRYDFIETLKTSYNRGNISEEEFTKIIFDSVGKTYIQRV